MPCTIVKRNDVRPGGGCSQKEKLSNKRVGVSASYHLQQGATLFAFLVPFFTVLSFLLVAIK